MIHREAELFSRQREGSKIKGPGNRRPEQTHSPACTCFKYYMKGWCANEKGMDGMGQGGRRVATRGPPPRSGAGGRLKARGGNNNSKIDPVFSRTREPHEGMNAFLEKTEPDRTVNGAVTVEERRQGFDAGRALCDRRRTLPVFSPNFNAEAWLVHALRDCASSLTLPHCNEPWQSTNACCTPTRPWRCIERNNRNIVLFKQKRGQCSLDLDLLLPAKYLASVSSAVYRAQIIRCDCSYQGLGLRCSRKQWSKWILTTHAGWARTCSSGTILLTGHGSRSGAKNVSARQKRGGQKQ